MASASASATGVAPVATLAFQETLGPAGLEAVDIFKIDWEDLARRYSQESDGIINKYYTELQHRQWRLDRILQILGHGAEQLEAHHATNRDRHGAAWFSSTWTVIFGESGLSKRKRLCQHEMDTCSTSPTPVNPHALASTPRSPSIRP